MNSALALVRTSKVFYPRFVPTTWCLSDSLVVFVYDDAAHFAILTSSFHWWWAIAPPGTGGSSFKSDPRYTTTKSFATFPQPSLLPELTEVGAKLNQQRDEMMVTRDIGLRGLYDLVNDANQRSKDAERIRSAHVRLDEAVLAAFRQSNDDVDWSDLRLDHDFYDCGGLGIRYTISEQSRNEMLQRLLELNFRRFATEVGSSYNQVLKDTGNV